MINPAINSAAPTFLGLPTHLPNGSKPKAIIFGAGHGSTYPGKDSSGYAGAADAIRAASQEDAPLVTHWDFDLGGPLFNGEDASCIDIGNLATVMGENAQNREKVEATTRNIMAQSAVPILLGGDNSLPIPFFKAFAGLGPIWIVQIDAHMDWRDELHGEKFGYSSPMRRASEMPHIAGMVQIGLRSVGSARPQEIAAAQAFGSRMVTARDIHHHGIETALAHIPEGAQVIITVDCDGLDPAIMPGVAARTPGGLTYFQVTDLIANIGKRARIAGFDLVEFYPPNDMDGMSALVASRVLVNAIGTIVRQREAD
ncbi:agmatinase [Thalassospira profundimaris]|uniref:Agmatinase n=1 Tax=Thalassospira profundimaris TaxID=502049 RepID=A0A367X9Z6_9PROT|nr:agmatinase [Thalassospira profundimaris]RCK49940.1 agmatinase [Thalassospira profundimaris]